MTNRFLVLCAALMGCSAEAQVFDEAEKTGRQTFPLYSPGEAMCGRHSSGLHCVFSLDTTFGGAINWQTSFGDAGGWGAGPEYYRTIRYPDVNGDGDTDVCARGASGIKCALSSGPPPFGSLSVWSSDFGDLSGWTAVQHYSTIQYPDVNGDGKADVCGRAVSGVKCALSTGAGFGGLSLWASAFSDASGYGTAPYYRTIQFADLDGDQKDDICGRGPTGLHCALSTGTTFGSVTNWSSSFSDASGWNGSASLYSTIKLVDVDRDFQADVCARAGSGIKCALSTGSSFGSLTSWQPSNATAFSDANGYNSVEYYSTIQFGDLNADGLPDVCSRAGSGVKCAISNGSSFAAASLWSSTYSDAGGWNTASHYSTIKLSDLDRDGQWDICGRGASGLKCALSNGGSFGSVSIWSSFFSDANGFDTAPYYSSLAFSDP